MRPAVIACVAILFLANPGAAWNQAGGDGGRTQHVDLPAGPWDIVDAFDILGPNEAFHGIVPPVMVPVGGGAIGVARDLTLLGEQEQFRQKNPADDCTIIHLADIDARETRRVPTGLRSCWTVGYAAEHDLYLMCSAGTYDVAGLRAYRVQDLADGLHAEPVWHVNAADVGMTEAMVREPAPSTSDPTTFDIGSACIGPAIDGDRVIAPFISTRMGLDMMAHRIASIQLADGSVDWHLSIPHWESVPQYSTTSACSGGPDGTCPDVTGYGLIPLMASVSTTGIAVTFVMLCADFGICNDVDPEGGEVALFNPTRMGLATIHEDPVTDTTVVTAVLWGNSPWHLYGQARGEADLCNVNCRWGGIWATADREVFHAVLGYDQMVIDPIQGPRSAFDHDWSGALSPHFSFPAPTIYGEHSIYAFAGNVHQVDATSGADDWRWRGFGLEWTNTGFDRAVTSNGDYLSSSTSIDDVPNYGNAETYVVIPQTLRSLFFDTATGQLQQILPSQSDIIFTDEPQLGFEDGSGGRVSPPFWWPSMSAILPYEERFLRVSAGGQVVVFEPADPSNAPALTISTLYPAPDEEVQIVLQRADHPNAKGITLNWGDGALDPIDWPADVEELNFTARADVLPEDVPVRIKHVYTTILYDDGTTRTRDTSLRISQGLAPPPGPPDRLALPTPATPYPEVAKPFDVFVPRPSAPDLVEVVADWGDGHIVRSNEAKEVAVFNHTYRESGRKDATFTAVFLDGSTSSQTLSFDVGGRPAEPQTWLQERFSRENQEVSLFVVGLFITLFGAAIAYTSRRLGRARIKRELKRLRGIRAVAENDPKAALAALATMRRDLNQRLVRGRLNEGQVQLIEERIRRFVAAIQTDVLEPVAGRASAELLALTTLSLRDNRLDAGEHAKLVQALAAEKRLTDDDRHRFAMLIDAAKDRAWDL